MSSTLRPAGSLSSPTPDASSIRLATNSEPPPDRHLNESYSLSHEGASLSCVTLGSEGPLLNFNVPALAGMRRVYAWCRLPRCGGVVVGRRLDGSIRSPTDGTISEPGGSDGQEDHQVPRGFHHRPDASPDTRSETAVTISVRTQSLAPERSGARRCTRVHGSPDSPMPDWR
jgi:hypothetical protein